MQITHTVYYAKNSRYAQKMRDVRKKPMICAENARYAQKTRDMCRKCVMCVKNLRYT